MEKYYDSGALRTLGTSDFICKDRDHNVGCKLLHPDVSVIMVHQLTTCTICGTYGQQPPIILRMTNTELLLAFA